MRTFQNEIIYLSAIIGSGDMSIYLKFEAQIFWVNFILIKLDKNEIKSLQ